jgi:hypothetical protein
MNQILLVSIVETKPDIFQLSYGRIGNTQKVTTALYNAIIEGIKHNDNTALPLFEVMASVVESVKAFNPEIGSKIRHQVIEQLKKR